MSDADGAANGACESPGAAKQSAAKDRNCPYCGQAFTSSSLGRHLDLYIKEKNPKPPDGIHDVDAIRKMRGGITRRQPRGSLARREVSAPGTPTGSVTASKSPAPASNLKRPSLPKEGQYVVDQTTAKLSIFHHGWEATGVINDIPAKSGDGDWDEGASQQQDQSRRPGAQMQQRASSRVAQRQQLDAKQKLADAMDTARAAELALRELLSSWRAAKQQIEMNSLPFGFDPLSLDFPALTVQCLQAPPTLFSSTPHPTSSSWSIQPPAQKQYDALKTWFQEEFRKWRVACAAATTFSTEELTYPPSQTSVPEDLRESVKKAEKAAWVLENQVNEHLQSTYQVWDQLSPQRKNELWTLELARGVGRRQKDLEKMKDDKHGMKQEINNLKIQIDQLNRLQQPREFRIAQPATLPFSEDLVSYCLEFGMKGYHGVGLNMDDRHSDLGTVVSRAIDRWKSVVVSSKAAGMSAQKPLNQAASTSSNTTTTPVAQPQPKAAPHNQHHASANPQSNESRSTATATTTSTSITNDDENSDEDADAEMEDENFAPISTPVAAKPPQQQPQLDVARTRGDNQQIPATENPRFVMSGAGNVGGRGMNMNRPIQNMQNHNQRGRAVMNNGDYGAVVTSVGGSDPMYMD